MNTAAERSTREPIPSATPTTSTYEPMTLPSAVATAVRRPCASARPITNSTLGPGITITRSDIAANARYRSVDTMFPSMSLNTPRRPRTLEEWLLPEARAARGSSYGSSPALRAATTASRRVCAPNFRMADRR